MKRLFTMVLLAGGLILGSCGVHSNLGSQLLEVTDNTSAANLPAGTIFTLKSDVNLLPWSTTAVIKAQEHELGLEVDLIYVPSGSDRILKKETTLTLKNIMDSYDVYLSVKTPHDAPFSIRTYFNEKDQVISRNPTLGELRLAFAKIEIPSGPTPVE